MLFGYRRMKRCQSGREEELARKPLLCRGHSGSRYVKFRARVMVTAQGAVVPGEHRGGEQNERE